MAKKNLSGQKKPEISEKLPLTNLVEQCNNLHEAGDTLGAIELYRSWVKKDRSPSIWIAYFNLGMLCGTIGDDESAINSYRSAIAANPNLPHARINLGILLEKNGKVREAIQEWRNAVKILDASPTPNGDLLCPALNNLGRCFESLQEYKDAEEALGRSLAVRSDQKAAIYHRIYLRLKQCAWPAYSSLPSLTLEDQIKSSSMISMISLWDDPPLLLERARQFVADNCPLITYSLSEGVNYNHKRLRIGYLSGDLCTHAVGLLTVGLFESHDRNNFEVFAFSWSREDKTKFRERIIKSFDRYVDISQFSDADAAKLIRHQEIDILVDLQGLTLGYRSGILASRPAPIQITYLGFPGTSPLQGVDYILADRYLIPEPERDFYAEKVIYLPNCFQISDQHRDVDVTLDRASQNLPETGFIFCSFNNNYKISESVFAVWMQILHKVEGSVLWLIADNPWAEINLKDAAKKAGIDTARLIFTKRTSPAKYLARYPLADLFLDTYPFGGGTTANDALWMNLPVLTHPGRTFSSRMAGSLLINLGMPELIVDTWEDYEQKAIEIGKNPILAKELRDKLIRCKKETDVFDTVKKTRHIEKVFFELTNRQPIAAELADAVSSVEPVNLPAKITTGNAEQMQSPLVIELPTDEEKLPQINSPESPSSGKIRLAIYTIVTKDEESLYDILSESSIDTETDLEIHFYCFTDRRNLSAPTWLGQKTETKTPVDYRTPWRRFIQLESSFVPTEKLFSGPKARPYQFLADYDYSLYLKNGTQLKRLPILADLTGSLFKTLRRTKAVSLIEAADNLIRSGFGQSDSVARQMSYYKKRKLLDSRFVTVDDSVLLRKHGDYYVKKLGEMWWEQILVFSDYDFLSLDLCLALSGCRVDFFYEKEVDNNLFDFSIKLPETILDNFDADRYAWQWREDFYARSQPRKHFLTHAEPGESYDRFVSWFDYFCDRERSSLGTLTPPSRKLAPIISHCLATNPVSRLLLAGVSCEHPFAIDSEELIAARSAISGYTQNRATVTLAMISEPELYESASFQAATTGASGFNLILVIGLPAAAYANALHKFVALLAQGATLIVVFNEKLLFDQITEMYKPVKAMGKLEIFHSHHIMSEWLIPSSAFLFTANTKIK